MEIDNKELESFLKELTKLTKKYHIAIGGCGCCGSPYLTKLELDDISGKLKLRGYVMDDNLNFNEIVQRYVTEEDKKEIKRLEKELEEKENNDIDEEIERLLNENDL